MENELLFPSLWPVTAHTNYVGKNSTFVAIQGNKEDGTSYIPLALQKGARTIIAEYTADIAPQVLQAISKVSATLEFVPNARRALALLAAQKWFYPAKKLKIIGVTGTKGKTTTAWLLHHILQTAGHKVALISTVKNKIGNYILSTDLTTPHPDYLHAFFHTCINQGIEYVVMEVAAQAITLQRIAGIEFDGIIFTNFAPAHGEFYATPQEYFAAKAQIVHHTKSNGIFLLNGDDTQVSALATSGKNAQYFTINNKIASFFHVKEYSYNFQGIRAVLQSAQHEDTVHCPALVGEYNITNVLAAMSMAHALGIDWDKNKYGIASFSGVPGRLEKHIMPNGAVAIIDYAHNPLSFQALLHLLRSMTHQLIVVTGAGGDRDQVMRPVLGQIMSEFADYIVLTSDNPRSENPQDIIAALYSGISIMKKNKTIIEIERDMAIKKAYALSSSGTIIALLGKGAEEYQLIGTSKVPFKERIILQQLSLG